MLLNCKSQDFIWLKRESGHYASVKVYKKDLSERCFCCTMWGYLLRNMEHIML